jgi:hypothetical protein
MTDTAGWQSSIELAAPPSALPATAREWAAALEAELLSVMPTWQAAHSKSGRTMVANARLAPMDWAPYASQFLDGSIPESPVAGISSAVLLRYTADDIKAMYYEAVQLAEPRPSIRQIEQWFWHGTLAADFLRALRAKAIESDHKGFNTACSRFVVPMPYVERLT